MRDGHEPGGMWLRGDSAPKTRTSEGADMSPEFNTGSQGGN